MKIVYYDLEQVSKRTGVPKKEIEEFLARLDAISDKPLTKEEIEKYKNISRLTHEDLHRQFTI